MLTLRLCALLLLATAAQAGGGPSPYFCPGRDGLAHQGLTTQVHTDDDYCVMLTELGSDLNIPVHEKKKGYLYALPPRGGRGVQVTDEVSVTLNMESLAETDDCQLTFLHFGMACEDGRSSGLVITGESDDDAGVGPGRSAQVLAEDPSPYCGCRAPTKYGLLVPFQQVDPRTASAENAALDCTKNEDRMPEYQIRELRKTYGANSVKLSMLLNSRYENNMFDAFRILYECGPKDQLEERTRPAPVSGIPDAVDLEIEDKLTSGENVFNYDATNHPKGIIKVGTLDADGTNAKAYSGTVMVEGENCRLSWVTFEMGGVGRNSGECVDFVQVRRLDENGDPVDPSLMPGVKPKYCGAREPLSKESASGQPGGKNIYYVSFEDKIGDSASLRGVLPPNTQEIGGNGFQIEFEINSWKSDFEFPLKMAGFEVHYECESADVLNQPTSCASVTCEAPQVNLPDATCPSELYTVSAKDLIAQQGQLVIDKPLGVFVDGFDAFYGSNIPRTMITVTGQNCKLSWERSDIQASPGCSLDAFTLITGSGVEYKFCQAYDQDPPVFPDISGEDTFSMGFESDASTEAGGFRVKWECDGASLDRYPCAACCHDNSDSLYPTDPDCAREGVKAECTNGATSQPQLRIVSGGDPCVELSRTDRGVIVTCKIEPVQTVLFGHPLELDGTGERQNLQITMANGKAVSVNRVMRYANGGSEFIFEAVPSMTIDTINEAMAGGGEFFINVAKDAPTDDA